MTSTPAVRRPLVMGAVCAASFMIAIEVTIVSTAMPQIVAQLGGLELYAWVFSAFLLAQTATTVVFGKLSDVYGRRAVMLVGLAIFAGGSLLCGLAWSMPSLIAFRILQGLGAGAVQPITLTIVGDLYPPEERGKVQGYLASVWGVSSVVGPLAGGFIIQHVSWAWIFWINLPIAVLAALGFILYLREDLHHERRQVDYLGAALFTIAISALMLALTDAGSDLGTIWPTASIVCVAAAALFVWQERRAPDPMVAVGLWARRPILTANAATLLSGVVMMGITTFLPIYVQAVLGASSLVAGFTLTAMVLGWPIAATISPRLFLRFGLKPIVLLGAVLLPIGSIAFLLMARGGSAWTAGVGSLVVGFGMGFFSVSATVLIQECVGWAERGAATASNVFSRNLGQTLGATILGTVLNLSLAHSPAHIGSNEIRALLDHRGGADIAADALPVLGAALHTTFVSLFAIAVLTLLAALLVPPVAIERRGSAKAD